MNKRTLKATLSVAILFSVVTSNVAMSVESVSDTLQQYQRVAPVSASVSAESYFENVRNFFAGKLATTKTGLNSTFATIGLYGSQAVTTVGNYASAKKESAQAACKKAATTASNYAQVAGQQAKKAFARVTLPVVEYANQYPKTTVAVAALLATYGTYKVGQAVYNALPARNNTDSVGYCHTYKIDEYGRTYFVYAGTTYFVDEDGNKYIVNKDGSTRGLTLREDLNLIR